MMKVLDSCLPRREIIPEANNYLLPCNLIRLLQNAGIQSTQQMPSLVALTGPKVMILDMLGDFLEACEALQNRIHRPKRVKSEDIVGSLMHEDPNARWKYISGVIKFLFMGNQGYSATVKYNYQALQYAVVCEEVTAIIGELAAISKITRIPLDRLVIETGKEVKIQSFGNFPL